MFTIVFDSDNMSSLDKMVTSSQKRRSPDLLFNTPTSSQKWELQYIKDKAEDKLYNAHYDRRNGIFVRVQHIPNSVETRNMKGYKMTHELRFVKNANTKDPTWLQLKKFLETNTTFKNRVNGRIEYKCDEFMCADFMQTLFNNAQSAGIRCAKVGIQYADGSAHAMNAFKTTDKGLVFVDLANKTIVSDKNFFSQGETLKQYVPDFADFLYPVNSQYVRDIAEHLQLTGNGMKAVFIDW
jgi:hypothetical protein